MQQNLLKVEPIQSRDELLRMSDHKGQSVMLTEAPNWVPRTVQTVCKRADGVFEKTDTLTFDRKTPDKALQKAVEQARYALGNTADSVEVAIAGQQAAFNPAFYGRRLAPVAFPVQGDLSVLDVFCADATIQKFNNGQPKRYR